MAQVRRGGDHTGSPSVPYHVIDQGIAERSVNELPTCDMFALQPSG